MLWGAAREGFLRCFSERALHVLEASAMEREKGYRKLLHTLKGFLVKLRIVKMPFDSNMC